jgi:hypothetical protein
MKSGTESYFSEYSGQLPCCTPHHATSLVFEVHGHGIPELAHVRLSTPGGVLPFRLPQPGGLGQRDAALQAGLMYVVRARAAARSRVPVEGGWTASDTELWVSHAPCDSSGGSSSGTDRVRSSTQWWMGNIRRGAQRPAPLDMLHMHELAMQVCVEDISSLSKPRMIKAKSHCKDDTSNRNPWL